MERLDGEDTGDEGLFLGDLLDGIWRRFHGMGVERIRRQNLPLRTGPMLQNTADVGSIVVVSDGGRARWLVVPLGPEEDELIVGRVLAEASRSAAHAPVIGTIAVAPELGEAPPIAS